MARTAGAWYRRAIVLYFGMVVLPACILVLLGLQSFERQREALNTLRLEKLQTELEARLRVVAQTALDGTTHPVVKHLFTIDRGEVTRPVLHAPPPLPTPLAFQQAERDEGRGRPDLALGSYRRLLATHPSKSLALAGIARCLTRLDRDAEARHTWRTLARLYPDDRDLSHRPYGIVAAMAAGDNAGLYDQIASGRWALAGEQAEHFLDTLDPARRSPYLDQFSFARELSARFRPAELPRGDAIVSEVFGNSRIFYRADGSDRIVGFEANREWIDRQLRPDLERALAGTNTGRLDAQIYGSAVALVLLMLSAGVALIWRDLTRETRTNQLRADFVSGVTHELKTPITLIRLYGETLLRHDRLPETERRTFFRIITRESARLGRLVDQVLAFSHVERAEDHYDLRESDLAPAVARIVDDYSEWLEHQGFSIALALPESSPPVRFDVASLQQVLVNVLDNAAKYSGASRAIAVRLTPADGSVILEVEDHGIGIPAAEHSRIFERFHRVANGSGRGGYGLGLFMVRHIMLAHGGHAEVVSEPGRGSTFRLVFPSAPTAHAEPEQGVTTVPRADRESAWQAADTKR